MSPHGHGRATAWYPWWYALDAMEPAHNNAQALGTRGSKAEQRRARAVLTRTSISSYDGGAGPCERLRLQSLGMRSALVLVA